MKKTSPLALALAVLFLATQFTHAADAQKTPESPIKAEVMAISQQVREKIKAGKDSEADLAESFKAIDGLIAKHASEKSDDVAGVYMLKAQIYLQVLEDDAKAGGVLNQVVKNFPETKAAKAAEKMLSQIKAQAAGKAVQRALAIGTKFPNFAETNLVGQPLSIAGLKGKVVLIDFWATWCPPCRAELPNVIKAYTQHHAAGFEVIGISLDSDRDKLDKFLAAQKMTWPQYFDGKGWGNKLANQYGVHSIPATYLLDREGIIIGKGLRGEALAEAVAKALAKK